MLYAVVLGSAAGGGFPQWNSNAPPDEQAVEILRLIDGVRDIEAIIDQLVRRYEAPRQVIAGDVVAMLQDLVDKKVLRR